MDKSKFHLRFTIHFSLSFVCRSFAANVKMPHCLDKLAHLKHKRIPETKRNVSRSTSLESRVWSLKSKAGNKKCAFDLGLTTPDSRLQTFNYGTSYRRVSRCGRALLSGCCARSGII